jgi:hypothetical protein
MSLILDFVPELKEEELSFVNKVMSDKNNDARYLVPGSYIYLMEQYAKRGGKLSNVKPILISFIKDNMISDDDQRNALETLGLFIDSKDLESKRFLQKIFNKKDKNEHEQQLANISNAILVAKFKDKAAIDWRFEQIKKPLEFDRKKLMGVFHSVGSVEEELNSMKFARPLIDLNDEKYLPSFLNLIGYSSKILAKDRNNEYRDYVNYLWGIVIAFVEKLQNKNSFKPIIKLETWISKNNEAKNLNWLQARIRELRKIYINNLGKKSLDN